jgi:hypothetical protein
METKYVCSILLISIMQISCILHGQTIDVRTFDNALKKDSRNIKIFENKQLPDDAGVIIWSDSIRNVIIALHVFKSDSLAERTYNEIIHRSQVTPIKRISVNNVEGCVFFNEIVKSYMIICHKKKYYIHVDSKNEEEALKYLETIIKTINEM